MVRGDAAEPIPSSVDRPAAAKRPRMIPVLGGDSAEDVVPGYEILLDAGIPGHAFGSRGWYVVVREEDAPRARSLLEKDESARKFLMTEDEVRKYVERNGYGGGSGD